MLILNKVSAAAEQFGNELSSAEDTISICAPQAVMKPFQQHDTNWPITSLNGTTIHITGIAYIKEV